MFVVVFVVGIEPDIINLTEFNIVNKVSLSINVRIFEYKLTDF